MWHMEQYMPVRDTKSKYQVSHYIRSQIEDQWGSLTRLASLAAYARRDCKCSIHNSARHVALNEDKMLPANLLCVENCSR